MSVYELRLFIQYAIAKSIDSIYNVCACANLTVMDVKMLENNYFAMQTSGPTPQVASLAAHVYAKMLEHNYFAMQLKSVLQ